MCSSLTQAQNFSTTEFGRYIVIPLRVENTLDEWHRLEHEVPSPEWAQDYSGIRRECKRRGDFLRQESFPKRAFGRSFPAGHGRRRRTRPQLTHPAIPMRLPRRKFARPAFR